MYVRGREEVKGVWKSHFESLINDKTERKAMLSSMGREADGKRGEGSKENNSCGCNNLKNVKIRRKNSGRMDVHDRDFAWKQREVPDRC